MTTKLKNYFPMLKERETLLAEIKGEQKLNQLYNTWTEEQQEEFLDFCTGVRGIKFLYDSFFKEVMDPEIASERLEEFLSLILKERVQIIDVLPPDSVRIADETTLLIMDIVVELEDGRLVNLEVQKIGYKFPGERCACYSCDLLLRQYKRVRSEKKKNFSYKDIKGVYTIVLYEKSPKEFHEFPNDYIHHANPKFDTGLKLNLLQDYVMIPLDIYKQIYHNKIKNKCLQPFDNKLEAWLALLSMDDPEVVVQLITEYPEFKAMYEDVYRMCLNTEGVMQMFSKELAELDRNTVQLMIDEMQDEINAQAKELEDKDKVIEDKEKELEDKDKVIEDKEKELEDKDKVIEDKEKELEDKDKVIEDKKKELEDKNKKIEEEQKKQEAYQKQMREMISAIYSNVKDVNKVAQMTGCSVEEIKEAIV